MKQGKYLFPSFEKAKEMKDSLISTEENPNNHQAFGLKQECIKQATEDEEAEYSDCWQLDVAWFGIDEHPYGWKKYAVDIKGQGNTRIAGIDYNKVKL